MLLVYKTKVNGKIHTHVLIEVFLLNQITYQFSVFNQLKASA